MQCLTIGDKLSKPTETFKIQKRGISRYRYDALADLVVCTTHGEGGVGSIRKTDDKVEFSIDTLLGADDLKVLSKQRVLGMGYQHPFRRFPCERGSVFRSVPE
jgi:hypothetical protein